MFRCVRLDGGYTKDQHACDGKAPGPVQSYNGVSPVVTSVIGAEQYGAMIIVSGVTPGSVSVAFFEESVLASGGDGNDYTDACKFTKGPNGWTPTCMLGPASDNVHTCNPITGAQE